MYGANPLKLNSRPSSNRPIKCSSLTTDESESEETDEKDEESDTSKEEGDDHDDSEGDSEEEDEDELLDDPAALRPGPARTHEPSPPSTSVT